MTTSDIRNFWCNGLEVHFSYEFMFSSLDFSNFVPTEEDDNESTIKKKLNQRENLCKELEKEGNYKKVGLHVGEEGHITIKPLLFLKIPHLRVFIKEEDLITISGKINDEIYTLENVKLDQRLILFESGMGVCIFVLHIGKAQAKIGEERRTWRDGEGFEKEHIIAISRIARRRKQTKEKIGKLDLSIENGRKYLHQEFMNEVDKLKSLLKTYLKDNVQWIEKDKNLVFPLTDVESVKEEKKETWYFQDPYALIVMKAPRNVYEYFLDVDVTYKDAIRLAELLPQQRDQYYRDVSTILLIGSDETKVLDKSHLKHYIDSDGRLANMCASSKFFMHLDMRVAIAIYDEKDSTTALIESSIPTFVETINFLRMRWHTYVVADIWLDELIKKICYQFRKVRDKPEILEKLLKKQLEIILVRSEMLRCLQDPITYQTSSGSSIILYKKGVEKFHINELQNIVLNKLDELHKLHDMISQYLSRVGILDEYIDFKIKEGQRKDIILGPLTKATKQIRTRYLIIILISVLLSILWPILSGNYINGIIVQIVPSLFFLASFIFGMVKLRKLHKKDLKKSDKFLEEQLGQR